MLNISRILESYKAKQYPYHQLKGLEMQEPD
jgi:hypothetical protein